MTGTFSATIQNWDNPKATPKKPVFKKSYSAPAYSWEGALLVGTLRLAQAFKKSAQADFVCIAAISIARDLSLKAGGSLAVRNRSYTDETRLRGFQEVQKVRAGGLCLYSRDFNRQGF